MEEPTKFAPTLPLLEAAQPERTRAPRAEVLAAPAERFDRSIDEFHSPAAVGGKFYHPFKVVPGTTAGTVQVIAASYVWGMLAESVAPCSVSGFSTDLSPGAGEGIFLHGTVTEGEVMALEIVVEDDDGVVFAFDEGDPPEQTDFWLPIAVVGAVPEGPAAGVKFTIEGDAYFVFQWAFTHYRLENHCADGQPVIYPVPM